MHLHQRILPLLQLTRLALVFTAVADSGCAWMLQGHRDGAGNGVRALVNHMGPFNVLAIAAASIGLYGFAMSLNDIIDRRRDAHLAAYRPLPSGRIGVQSAHVVCALLATMALASAGYFSLHSPAGPLSFGLAIFTLLLIIFYNVVGKYLIAPGLLTLGLIRFFNAAIPCPTLPVIWQPLLLLNHSAIVWGLAYHWEQKRPPMKRSHVAWVLGGLLAIDVLLIGTAGGTPDIERGLLPPALAIVIFALLALLVRYQSRTPRAAGEALTLLGVLWFIVYDASFVAGFIAIRPALAILALLPVSALAVMLNRGWNQLVSLSQRPAFRRIEVD